MIELNQAAQCLFCPQRRKIAMLLKLILAASAAIIMGLILFLPQANRAQVRRGSGGSTQSSKPSSSGSIKPAIDISAIPSAIPDDAASRKSKELRDQAQRRFLEVQAQIRELLVESPPKLADAEKLIAARRKEVFLAKVLTLGEDAFAGSGRAEGQKKMVLDFLENELETLSEQSQLLSQLGKVSRP